MQTLYRIDYFQLQYQLKSFTNKNFEEVSIEIYNTTQTTFFILIKSKYLHRKAVRFYVLVNLSTKHK